MRLANDSPSFTPVHPQIRAIGPRNLHHAKGRGRMRSGFDRSQFNEKRRSKALEALNGGHTFDQVPDAPSQAGVGLPLQLKFPSAHRIDRLCMLIWIAARWWYHQRVPLSWLNRLRELRGGMANGDPRRLDRPSRRYGFRVAA